tara:strand:- start:7795 stop:8253 length:459 start_codon:yes stop_codon:yes gene_type:complete
MKLRRSWALTGEVHIIKFMAVPAFQRIISLKSGPFVLGEIQAFGLKFLAGVYRAKKFTVELFRCSHFAGDFIGPFMWDVAIGTRCPHTGPVGIVDRRFKLLKNIIFHFVTANTESFRIGQFQGGIECTPEYNSSHEPADGEKAKAEMDARAS